MPHAEHGHFIVESSIAVARYQRLKELATYFSTKCEFKNGQAVTPADVEVAKEFLATSATEVSPLVWPVYWDHIFLASAMGKEISTLAKQKGVEVEPSEIELLLWLHDIGRLVAPSGYLRNDFIGNRILKECGMPLELLNQIPSTEKLMIESSQMQFTDTQRTEAEPLTAEQEILVNAYYEELSDTQKVIDLADNLGKKDKTGNIFSLEIFQEYLATQEKRYQQSKEEVDVQNTRTWPSIEWSLPRRQDGAFLQLLVIRKIVNWLQTFGIDVNSVTHQVADSGARVIEVTDDSEKERVLVLDKANQLFTWYFKKTI